MPALPPPDYILFPAQAGVIPMKLINDLSDQTVPRASGGDPSV